MKKSNSKTKAQSAFWKLGAVALITATLAVCFTACKQTGGGNSGGGGTQGAPFVEGGASLILSPDNLTIKVGAKTEDGSDIAVEGCEETTLKSNAWTELHAKGTTVILKGKIVGFNCESNKLTELNVQGLTSLQELVCYNNELISLNVQGLTALKELDCSDNKLTELNVQGLTALKKLECYENKLTALNVQGCTSLQELNCSYNQLTELNVQGCTSLQKLECRVNKLPELNVSGLTALNFVSCYYNQLNAQAMTKLLNALPAREENDVAKAILYAEETGKTEEGNCKDYTQPAELKKALEDAKSRNWTLAKFNTSENSWVEI